MQVLVIESDSSLECINVDKVVKIYTNGKVVVIELETGERISFEGGKEKLKEIISGIVTEQPLIYLKQVRRFIKASNLVEGDDSKNIICL
ncbi:hypothetical protein ACPB8Q_05120 [Methanocaldococcus indicus]|uniref:hypothetical protein n=1 Tax=Methanocaldococcus indicus TaxID=213231 RepID=UPI003C6D223C